MLPGRTFSHMFTKAGAFPYYCTPHFTSMVGTVTVRAAVNVPPTVSITSPANGATFTSPASVTIQAAASDADGIVVKVGFFNGSGSVGTDTASPYSQKVTLYPGTYIRILEGPVCSDNFWWWKVQIYPGTTYGLQGYSYSQTWTTNQTYSGWAREGWDNIDTYFICQ